MKYTEIKLEGNKSILVDESAEIKEGTYYENNGVIFLSDEIYDKGNNPNNSNPKVTDFNNKLIATINHSISLDVPMVVVEDDVEKLALSLYKEDISDWDDSSMLEYDRNIPKRDAFIKGCEMTQQKGVYLEEDLRKGINAGLSVGYSNSFNIDDKTKEISNIIQSLKQQYIELEMEEHTEWLEKNQGQTMTPITYFKIKKNRVDGQLIAYLKQ